MKKAPSFFSLISRAGLNLIKPLVEMTDHLSYSWHDFVSKNNHNALTVLCLWAPVVAKEAEKSELVKGAIKAVQDLYDVARHDFLTINLREHYDTWNLLSKARNEGRLFMNFKWPRDAELKTHVKRLYSLLSIKDSAANIPRNIESRRRREFFTNSLFMDLPAAKPVREMLSFRNFLARIGRDENSLDSELFDIPNDILELRFWASCRGQTLARIELLYTSKDENSVEIYRLWLV